MLIETTHTALSIFSMEILYAINAEKHDPIIFSVHNMRKNVPTVGPVSSYLWVQWFASFGWVALTGRSTEKCANRKYHFSTTFCFFAAWLLCTFGRQSHKELLINYTKEDVRHKRSDQTKVSGQQHSVVDSSRRRTT